MRPLFETYTTYSRLDDKEQNKMIFGVFKDSF